jgi:catechol 2,3-dioxygenase-like lactoylglutathione lyase family enzyme
MQFFLVELTVSDWPASVAWYRDRLGLSVERFDEPNRYALFAAGSARIALKAGEPASRGAKLVFQVDDLEANLDRFSREGVVTDDPVKASVEGYRSARVVDPDGYRIELFEWVR